MIKGGRSYLSIDNRASGGKLLEFDTLTCVHCNTIVVLNKQRKRQRGWCRKCNAYVCDSVGCMTDCNPIEQGIELAQKFPGVPSLPRDKQGRILFDPLIKESMKIYPVLTGIPKEG